jgi:glycerol-3-phosphate dehydrogenase (NAD(P)+)
MQRFIAERRNEYLTMPESVRLCTNLSAAVADAETIVISVNSQGLSSLMEELRPLALRDRYFVLCMKGIEVSTGRRLSEIVTAATDPSNKVAVWLGPGHVQEFIRGVPNCMVIDSDDDGAKEHLISAFSGSLIRFYYGTDLLGNEIGAAAKNVVGIAAGALDGLGLATLKGALMSRGTREVARLISAMGGNELSAYGLCHLGDYEATVFSEHSHNRRFGELFVRGEHFDKLAEGYYTTAAMVELGQKYDVELPICETIYRSLYENADIQQGIDRLFTRTLKTEF